MEQLLGNLECSPNSKLNKLDILPELEKVTLLDNWNATKVEYPLGLLHEVFESQVAYCSERIAIGCNTETLTYNELSMRSNGIASALRSAGVSRGQRVGLCVERGVDMLAAALGILRAGAAYVPLDPGFPAERLRFMVEDAELSFLVSTAALADSLTDAFSLPPERQLLLDADASKLLSESTQKLAPDTELDARPEDPAYIIYTSGSTGKPKGVVVPHRAVVNFLNSMAQEPGLKQDDVLVAVTTLSFDIAVLELYLPLMQGASVVIASREETMDGHALSQLLEQRQATIMQATPATWRLLLGAGWKGNKRFKALVGGEALPKDLADQLLGHNIELWNMYGPTETTVWSTCAHITDTTQGISIGKPIANTTVYVLDEQKRLCPIGVSGELYIGGNGVTLGYWNQPGLTAERFIDNPFNTSISATLYRTGDRACWRNDGTLEHQGRLDFQVKVRGFRIELGEIEAALAECSAIQHVAVYLWSVGSDDVRIVACCVPTKTGELTPANLRKHLRVSLPEYMIPQYFLSMDDIPLTPNGKVDRKQLPTPSTAESSTYVEPQTATEKSIVDIWTDVLQLEQVGINDDFFALGGHSLLALTVVEKMRRFGLNCDVRTLFLNPTVNALANTLRRESELPEVPPNLIPEHCQKITPDMLPLVDLNADEIDQIASLVPGGVENIKDIYPLTPLQEGFLFHHLMDDEGDIYLLSYQFAFDDRDSLDRYLKAMQTTIDRHDIFRTAILWEKLSAPLQVVYRHVPLMIKELNFDLTDGDIAQRLRAKFNMNTYRIDIREAPLVHCFIAHDEKNNRWLLQQVAHHLIGDQISMKLLDEELKHLLSSDDELPPPIQFRDFVAQSRLNVSQVEHKAFFSEMLCDVDEPTYPYGLVDTYGNTSDVVNGRVIIESKLAMQARQVAKDCGVSIASLFHLAWAMVLTRISAREDVVFGTVLTGRMRGDEVSNNVIGPCINTLPVRLSTNNISVKAAAEHMHSLLAQLMRHESASLVSAIECSSMPSSTPLFSSILNYRHGKDQSNELIDGRHFLDYIECTNYPLELSIDDFGDRFWLEVQVQEPLEPKQVLSYMLVARS